MTLPSTYSKAAAGTLIAPALIVLIDLTAALRRMSRVSVAVGRVNEGRGSRWVGVDGVGWPGRRLVLAGRQRLRCLPGGGADCSLLPALKPGDEVTHGFDRIRLSLLARTRKAGDEELAKVPIALELRLAEPLVSGALMREG